MRHIAQSTISLLCMSRTKHHHPNSLCNLSIIMHFEFHVNSYAYRSVELLALYLVVYVLGVYWSGLMIQKIRHAAALAFTIYIRLQIYICNCAIANKSPQCATRMQFRFIASAARCAQNIGKFVVYMYNSQICRRVAFALSLSLSCRKHGCRVGAHLISTYSIPNGFPMCVCYAQRRHISPGPSVPCRPKSPIQPPTLLNSRVA